MKHSQTLEGFIPSPTMPRTSYLFMIDEDLSSPQLAHHFLFLSSSSLCTPYVVMFLQISKYVFKIFIVYIQYTSKWRKSQWIMNSKINNLILILKYIFRMNWNEQVIIQCRFLFIPLNYQITYLLLILYKIKSSGLTSYGTSLLHR